jgi:nucleotide-binding universal stress UspA family protein
MPIAKRILCPIDFSERSLSALAVAASFAESLSSTLYVTHVICDFPVAATAVQTGVGFDLDALRSQLERDAVERLRSLIAERIPVRIYTRYVIAHGDPAREIAAAVRGKDIGLVVMASQGQSLLRKLVLGSVTEGVIRRCECPVLVMRPKT